MANPTNDHLIGDTYTYLSHSNFRLKSIERFVLKNIQNHVSQKI